MKPSLASGRWCCPRRCACCRMSETFFPRRASMCCAAADAAVYATVAAVDATVAADAAASEATAAASEVATAAASEAKAH